jgi:hypothetical protein
LRTFVKKYCSPCTNRDIPISPHNPLSLSCLQSCER